MIVRMSDGHKIVLWFYGWIVGWLKIERSEDEVLGVFTKD